MADRAHLERVMKQLADDGKLVEAGWVGLRLAANLENAPADQLREMRLAFLGGAQHLFSSIMTVLDPGSEPTEADMKRLNLIGDELEAAAVELLASYPKAEAKAAKPLTPAELELVPTLGDKPIEKQYREVMRDLGRFLDRALGNESGGEKKTGFVLQVFPMNAHEGRCNYVSNARREDIIVLLREQLARFEGRAPEVSGHG